MAPLPVNDWDTIQSRVRLQHLSSLVPIDGTKTRINGFHWVTSVAKVAVESTAFLKPDRRAARVR